MSRERFEGRDDTRFKRPESVLVVVYTSNRRVLLLERVHPVGYWQSVTGSLHWGESTTEAARRELQEETGLSGEGLVDCARSSEFGILPDWRERYAPDVTRNCEHVFACELPAEAEIVLNSAEHRSYRWVARAKALEIVLSSTNRNEIARLVPDD